jgi:hypothetical protein
MARCYLRASHKRALDFGGSDAMSRWVDDIVHTPCDPVVPVRVTAASVAREIVVWYINTEV